MASEHRKSKEVDQTESRYWPLTTEMVFVNSMSDLFHEGVADDYIEQVCRVMQQASWHTFQVLTKRSEQMRAAPVAVELRRG